MWRPKTVKQTDNYENEAYTICRPLIGHSLCECHFILWTVGDLEEESQHHQWHMDDLGKRGEESSLFEGIQDSYCTRLEDFSIS